MRFFLVVMLFASLLGASTSLPAQAEPLDDGLSAYFAEDFDTAHQLLLPLAEVGDAQAQYIIGVLYKFGLSVAENSKQAAVWITLSAEQGNPLAQQTLGTMYDFGNGVIENDSTAIHWFLLAAAQGDVDAHANLGFIYSSEDSTAFDLERAYFWYNVAYLNGREVAIADADYVARELSNEAVQAGLTAAQLCFDSGFVNCD